MTHVIVATYPTRGEAQAVAQMLTSSGFDAVLVGDDAGGAIPHLTMGVSGLSVRVPADEVDAARDYLSVASSQDGDGARSRGNFEEPAPRLHPWRLFAAALALSIIVLGIAVSVMGA